MNGRCVTVVSAVAMGLMLPLSRARAQSGMLDDSTRYTVIEGTGPNNQHGPLQAIIIWRGPHGWDQPRGTARVRADSAFRWGRLQAEEGNESFFGMGTAYGLLSGDRHTLTLEGQTLDIPRRDSALVAVVEIPPDPLPRFVASARIPANALPETFWPKVWAHGDTSFVVRPRFERMNSLLRAALQQSPVVASLLK